MIGDTQFLNDVNQYQRQQYAQPSDPRVQGQSSAPIAPMPTTQQQGQNKLIGALVSPYNNMKSNWNTLTSDITDSSKPWYDRLGNGAYDAYRLDKNPTGNWGEQSTRLQVPQLADEHLGQADSNGHRPIKQSGYKVLQNQVNATPIQDNSSVIHSAANKGHIPTAPQAQLQHGLIGRMVDNYLNTVTGDAFQIGQQPQEAQPQDPNNIA